MRSPQHSDENGPSSTAAAQRRRVDVDTRGSITGSVIPTRMTLILARTRWHHGDMPITSTSIAHVRLTVTDIERSRRFYESVFGWSVLLEVPTDADTARSEEHTSELQSRGHLVCRLLLEKKK